MVRLQVVVVGEPTVGLDAAAGSPARWSPGPDPEPPWFSTMKYLEEVDQLVEQVVVIDKGLVVAVSFERAKATALLRAHSEGSPRIFTAWRLNMTMRPPRPGLNSQGA
jgi:hypothetical protein